MDEERITALKPGNHWEVLLRRRTGYLPAQQLLGSGVTSLSNRKGNIFLRSHFHGPFLTYDVARFN